MTILIVLLFFSGFFSASETALMSLNKIKLRHMVDEKVKGALLVNQLVEDPNKLLGSILVGNNIVNIGASALATSIAIEHFGYAGVGIATGVMTIFVLIFGEITPKTLASQNSEKVSLKVSRTISIITKLLSPIVIILTFVTNLVIRLFGGKATKVQPFITEEEFMTMVNVSHEEGILEVEERQMIHNVFEFGDSKVHDVMTPRTDMIALEVNSSYSDIMAVFKSEQFSRIPIYEDTIDNIIGVLYVKDLIFLDINKEEFKMSNYIRDPYFTFEFKRTAELFEEMRKAKVPIAIVLDEYGGTSGLITMEDLVEEIVGDIEDEYDLQEKEIEIVGENEYVVDGTTRLDLVNEMLNLDLQSEDFDSIGGFIIGLVGKLPEIGDTVSYRNLQFSIENIDKNRIDKIRVIARIEEDEKSWQDIVS